MHNCDAAVVTCIDFRFQKFIRKFTDENLNDKLFDLVSVAGSTKNLEFILQQIDVSFKLHRIKEIYLIHHEDCGAYGSDSTFERHSEDLKKAKNEIVKRHPELKVYLYYLTLDGNFTTVS